MSDSDILDLLFDQGGGVLGGETVNKKEADMADFDFNSLPADLMIADLGVYKAEVDDSKFDFDSNWNSSFLNHTDTEAMLFNSLLNSNLPDDAKQHQTKALRHTDHAYSTRMASSPTSDSGFSNDPSSPSSCNSMEDMPPMSLEDELFGPLNLKDYQADGSLTGSDPMFVDNYSDSDGSTPDLHGNESPVSFEFEEVPQKSGKIIINTKSRPNELIKVVSVNKSKPNSAPLQSLLVNRGSRIIDSTDLSNSSFQELRLSDEEKELLRREGIALPTHLPLTREEEKLLRSIKRRIRNKASARNSRKKKQDYMEALEHRVKLCTEEKRQLEKKVNQLEKHNSSLVGQLRKLQKLVTEGTRHSARTGTCAMILALSFALVLLPSCRSLLGNNTEGSELDTTPQGRTSRTLLQTQDMSAADCTQEPSFFDFVPFLRKNNMGPLEPPCGLVEVSKDLVHDEVDGLTNDYATTGVKRKAFGPFIEDNDVNHNVKEEIHMEITKIPDDCIRGVCVKDEPPSKKIKAN